MPGLFSSIFDDGTDGGRDGQSSVHSAGGGGDLQLDPSITIESQMSGSYETPDGTMHSWDRTDSVTLDTDTQIVTYVTATLTQSDVDDG